MAGYVCQCMTEILSLKSFLMQNSKYCLVPTSQMRLQIAEILISYGFSVLFNQNKQIQDNAMTSFIFHM